MLVSGGFLVYWLYKEDVGKTEPWAYLVYDVM